MDRISGTGGNADRDAKENRKAADQPMSKKVSEERKEKIHRRKNRKSANDKLQQQDCEDPNKPQPGKRSETGNK